MTPNPELLIAVEQWHTKHWADLALEGIKMTLRPATTNREKNSASIDFESEDRALAALFWDSGEAEVLIANKFDHDAPSVTVHVVKSVRDVTALLNQVHSQLLGRTD